MLTYPQIDPIAIELGPLKVHWYGLMYLVGFSAAWLLGQQRRERFGLSKEQLSDLIFYGALGVVLGGRIGYVLFYNFDRFLADPKWLFYVWEGGMSFHGGLLGVTAVTLWQSRKLGLSLLSLGDFVAPLVPIGLGAGRIGNFIGGELWGRPTDVPWAMVFPRADNLPRHPSQLYEFVLEGIVLFTVLWLFSRKPRPAGAVSGLFLIGYGLSRIIVEFFRQPDEQLGYIAWGWLTQGQLLSLPMLAVGAGFIVYAYQSKRAIH
ncbi:prolipoprotein diacylglyceryl transferase [Pokkaliibacter plantistimulans]|uniref:Phosphatidylglycerol--prolipoprotein diacylglyceryl transferase n=2 Tax=Pseudomonadota TaxID=1224 RepID=A0ABX5M1X9_9GAMM|nr:prolipoprotein diacylglyceryl transferase [Pokkaliibacter plantistimulans]PPC77635.1 prolipoprotein diacylglyceryl transferase [Pokkaliibacter plantistimulans]PXF31683.1 prolipoprotein diacylglyceryl transferase [Pokkaliibacter plantistimulans]